ncbi:carboxypeptidase-like regulatory domain-containing protein [Lactobacillus sp. ESL0701]|uniref:carboxypeptidase-like regulatory domain-containing protein n=1 Tax=Lactobacillus sp. ESL0701 TaxID=2983217 RepID=UPI0023F8D132|nr:carboxypeptidase-like regulatory domain-containing protein [Lactobacillus sp. ESL0701]MDF7671749.1 carboxypeptidase-like regulatory domain-containing protein [Lactobacillus sp. ESL0701]
MKRKKLLTLLTAITLATSSVGIISVITTQNVQATKKEYTYYSPISGQVYDANGNAIPNGHVLKTDEYPVASDNSGAFTISTIKGNKYLKIGDNNFLRLDDLVQLTPIGTYVVKNDDTPICNASGSPISKRNTFYKGIKVVAFSISNINSTDYIYIGDGEYVPMSNVELVSSKTKNNSDTSKLSDEFVKPSTISSKPKKKNAKAKKHALIGDKHGIVKHFTVPKSWRRQWFNNGKKSIKLLKYAYNQNEITYGGFYIIGKVKGTNKYPWQKSLTWQDKQFLDGEENIISHCLQAKWKHMYGFKWMMTTGAYTKPSDKNFSAQTCHYENIDGHKILVLFRANHTGKVNRQDFTSKSLSKKYAHHKFPDMHYSSSF